MIAYFALGVLLLAGLLLIGRSFVSADPRRLAKIVRVIAILVGGAVVLYLSLTGRIGIASMVLFGLLPLLARWRALGRMWRNAAGPSPGQQSEVTTRFLRMSLDHDTGLVSGVVLDGPFRGRTLQELTGAELIDLLRQCRIEDPQSATLLESYLDRTDPGWRTADAEASRGPAAGMTQEEAYRILGLEPGADEAAIKKAHRELMQKVHPDRGGSSYLAAKINEAKDLLLRT